MGTRFAFDPPDELYAMKYAEVARGIEADLFRYRWQVIEEIGQERHNPDACELYHFASEADKPEQILMQAYDGIRGEEAKDVMTLAIGHVADYLTKNYVRGFWPEWERA